MKQIIQHLNGGETTLIEVPAPMVKDGHVLIRSAYSLVSKGTESMLVGFGKAGWLSKARQQPQQVRAVLDKVKTDGLIPTIEAVKSKISKPIPLGYSNAGIVIGVGAGVTGFKTGDRVASNGHHAEMVQVPQHLCAKVPDAVTGQSAAFTVVGAIALQGIRLLQPSFGETVVVFGLGLLGQLAVQLLLANGCRVIGIDTDEHKCAVASAAGATVICNAQGEQVTGRIAGLTNGADAILITAAARKDQIVSDAAQMSRKRGRIVLVGVVDLNLNRADFYEKELSFQVSCSYGPGRYDYQYEQNGLDYPIGFVRWTAQRNFEAVLQAMASGQLRTEPLITRIIPLSDYSKVYNAVSEPGDIATLFAYAQDINQDHKVQLRENINVAAHAVAVIGAGNFAAKVVVPLLKKAGANLAAIASENGLSAVQLAKQYNIPQALTDLELIWNDKNIGTVAIATRHNSHAALCIRALRAGKNVFVEKPLCLSVGELEAVREAYEESGCVLDIGFNRRHAPLASRMKELLGADPVNIVMTVNAGKIPGNNWLNDATASGGRIIGEVCHFIDLACFLSGALVNAVCTNALGESEEDINILLQLGNGSTAAINYFSNGHKGYDKERIEVYSSGRTLVLENWKRLSGYGFKGFSATSSVQDKGHTQQFSLLNKNRGRAGQALIPFAEIYNVTAASIAAVQSLRQKEWITV